MKKNTILFVLVMIFTMFILFATTNYTFALDGIFDGADKFEQIGANSYKTPNTIISDFINTDGLQSASSTIYNLLLAAGVIVAVIIGIVIAIQFITGSIEEKAKIKETLIPYVAGCAIIFGAFAIWKIVITVLKTV